MATMLLLLLLGVAFSTVKDEKFFFSRQPTDATMQDGNTHSIYCTVTPSNGLSYTWYKSDTFAEINAAAKGQLAPITGETHDTLYFGALESADTGYYRCKAETTMFQIFSNTAYLKVEYFDVKPLSKSSETLDQNSKAKYMLCNTPDSDPTTQIVWYKDDEMVDDSRMFVFPESKGGVQRGTLLIINVQEQDSGVYKCKTTHGTPPVTYELSEIIVSTGVSVSSPDAHPDIVYQSEDNLDVVRGGSITMVCAGTGLPTPTIEWTFNGQRVSSADSVFLQDNNRRLIVSNVNMAGKYECTLKNVVNGNPVERTEIFYLSLKEQSSSDIDIISVPESFVLYPNRYEPFTLQCSVRDTGMITMAWLKNGQARTYNKRIVTIDESTVTSDGVEMRNLNMFFETPNESDLGVYQCLLYNAERLKQQTAYVTLQKDEVEYEREKEPDYVFVDNYVTVDVAEDTCKYDNSIFPVGDGHLVSIMDMNENDKVNSLMLVNNVSNIWIGLTQENPIPEGYWKWTQPGDSSTVYSNWADDKPDNKYGLQEYAVMEKVSGKWVDVSKRVKHPFICKRYKKVCKSVDSSYKGRVSVRGWETTATTYAVGEQLNIYCTDITVKINETEIECTADGTFQPSKLDCPDVGSSAQRYHSNIFIVCLSMLTATLHVT